MKSWDTLASRNLAISSAAVKAPNLTSKEFFKKSYYFVTAVVLRSSDKFSPPLVSLSHVN